jgi:hypothetical protein
VEQDDPGSETIASRDSDVLRSRHRLVAVAAIVFAAVAVGSTLAAVHYHRQVARSHSPISASQAPHRPSVAPTDTLVHASPTSGTVVPASPPPLSMHSYDLATVGRLRATVYLTTASTDSGDSTQGQLLITALVRGGRPGTTYRLTGGDCDVNSSTDTVWAQGVADATGTAFLTGPDWTLPKADHYTLALKAAPSATSAIRPEPGIEGVFVLGQASRYNAQPCS